MWRRVCDLFNPYENEKAEKSYKYTPCGKTITKSELNYLLNETYWQFVKRVWLSRDYILCYLLYGLCDIGFIFIGNYLVAFMLILLFITVALSAFAAQYNTMKSMWIKTKQIIDEQDSFIDEVKQYREDS